MNIKELRIGNFVKIKNDAQKYTVLSIDSEMNKIKIKFGNHKISCDALDLSGIILTDEIITSLGFRKDKFGFNNNTQFSIGKTSGYYIYINDIQAKNSSVYFLHELQNVYYILTNSELNCQF